VKAVCAKYSLGRRRDALLTRQVDEGVSRLAWDKGEELPLLS
jgi:hypothetical protein